MSAGSNKVRAGLDEETDNSAREKVASWMIAHSIATGHGDTLNDLLGELSWQWAEMKARLTAASARLPQEGEWRTIDSAPAATSDNSEERVWTWNRRWSQPTLRAPDGEWWRGERKRGSTQSPTHWMPFAVPTPPAALDAAEHPQSKGGGKDAPIAASTLRVAPSILEGEAGQSAEREDALAYSAIRTKNRMNSLEKENERLRAALEEKGLGDVYKLLASKSALPAPAPMVDGEPPRQIAERVVHGWDRRWGEATADAMRELAAFIETAIAAERAALAAALQRQDEAVKALKGFVVKKNPLGPIGAYGSLALIHEPTGYLMMAAQNSYDEACLGELQAALSSLRSDKP